MHRRSYLSMAAASTAALAGCSGILGDSGGSSSDGPSNDDPAETVESFYTAAIDGDADAVRALLHPDTEMPIPSDRAIQDVADSSMRFEDATVVEQSGDSARVRVTLSRVSEADGERYENQQTLILRRADDEWLIYAREGRETGATAPTVQWEVEERLNDAGRVTAVGFTHVGGDTVDTAGLIIRAGQTELSAASGVSTLAAGDTIVAPFTDSGESIADGTPVSLIWTTGGRTIVGGHELSATTTGQPASQYTSGN